MKKFLTVVGKLLAGISAVLFVITAVATLLLANLESQLFNMNLYKTALLEMNVYEKMPGLFGRILITSMSYNPCEQNPVTCEDIPSQLHQCYLQVLGSERYAVLASQQEEPTEAEKQAIQVCLNQFEQAPSQGEQGEGEQGGMPDYFKNLDEEDWQALMAIILPPEVMQTISESALDGFEAYLEGKVDAVTISLLPLKDRLSGPAGIAAVKQLLLAQPACTLDELARLLGGELALCNPGEMELDFILPLFQEAIDTLLGEAIPNTATLIQPASARPPSNNPGPFGLNDDPQKAIQVVRFVLRVSLLLPILFLFLLTIFAVRSLKGWLRWWGIPFFFSGSIALGLGMAAEPLLNRAWNQYIFPRFPAYLPAELASLGHDLLAYIAHALTERVVLQALLLLMVGLAAWVLSYFLKSRKTDKASQGKTTPEPNTPG